MNTAIMPVVFVSHGAPDALLNAPDALEDWRKISQRCPRPSAILVISAHWEAQLPVASLAESPETIHDFGGFAPELYRMTYPAPGAPELARRAVELLSERQIDAGLSQNRGLDHGAWIALTVMYPDADIPVTQLSLIHNGSPMAHLKLGEALVPLRQEGVLIVATGSITHNFSWLSWPQKKEVAPALEAKALRFNDWVAEQVAKHDIQSLLDYRSAPNGADAHPTAEHFLPLFVALGAAGDSTPIHYHPPFSYGGLSMDAYLWE